MRWAIVIGIDEYGREDLKLTAAVGDAQRFHDWVVSETGGNVPPENAHLLLGPSPPDQSDRVPTKDNIVAAINAVMTDSGGGGDALFFYFSGHGITIRYANREESAIATPGFDREHTEHSLAVRSIAEFFETTQFRDQFFFLDACRNAPPESEQDIEIEVGRWPIPRRRDPGQLPAQQFILYATSPGRTAEEVGFPFPGESKGAFTDVLMRGLDGEADAKAWSWQRNGYEVRWERLANYINRVMKSRGRADVEQDLWSLQIPQDTGCRGVADRDRDPLLTTVPRGKEGSFKLTVQLKADSEYEADVSVVDAIGNPVASALNVTGKTQTFTLAPKTYAVRASTTDNRVGNLPEPLELYDDDEQELELRAQDGEDARGKGTIAIRSLDPLGTAEICDEAGSVIAVTTGDRKWKREAGFYRIRHVGPEANAEEQLVQVRPKRTKSVALEAPPPPEQVVKLVEALGGSTEDGYVIPVKGAKPIAWAQPATVVATAVGSALKGRAALDRLGVESPRAALGEENTGVAVYAVTSDGKKETLERLKVRVWPTGDEVKDNATTLEPSTLGVAAVYVPVNEAEPHWVAIEPEGADPSVGAVPVLPGRLATLVAQVDSDRVRVFQFHPIAGPHESSTPYRLRQMETLERWLLGGRVDCAEALAKSLAAKAAEDPFAGLLAGYVLLRLGRHKELKDLASAIVAVAPWLSDAYILRGEYEARLGQKEASDQAFADAVNTGIPAFGEGLTRLVEGLRAAGLVHPRGALVRHIFQRHARGSMWAAFTPRRKLVAGRLVIGGADLGFAG